MENPHDRSDRFELIAACDGDVLTQLANEVLADDPPLSVLQEPTPQLVMQRVVEPVEKRPFNLGEVVVTPAEVELDEGRGFAMVPGKNERAALSGAIVDAAVAGGHQLADDIATRLRSVAEDRQADRERAWAERTHTAVEFETMEDDL
ncbi:phosphonate C-P lyase system protein PhnG [Haloterrigena sp. H1]|uniref:phosphonate C-P lyase system protein PhnG n=1 Tax=Haloterrigena sp. H1 TaxID=2552943 RepID=UPI00110E0AAE|nr:phosphonate C-P lyase system protein PhnG [Haloterrigena sp. H1]TMT81538.1 phosphonate C-P lyase system protein PhnG [Haloterrigena sp. H1]